MTRKTFEVAADCISKIKGQTPKEEQIKEMLSFLSMISELAEICSHEGPNGLRLEAEKLPEDTAYEKAFKESIHMWIYGSDIDKASDHAADRYLEADPSGYDAAIFFAAVYSVGNILEGQNPYAFVDMALQYLLPDGWRWYEEDEKESKAHEDDEDWHGIVHSHRKAFLGDYFEERLHRYDDITIGDLLISKGELAVTIGRRIAEKLPGYKDGALQLIMKELTHIELERSLYVLPKGAEDRIISNIAPTSIPLIKGQCILNKDSVTPIDILVAVKKFEKAIDSYDGDPSLEAEYEY